jgi:fluoride exporter
MPARRGARACQQLRLRSFGVGDRSLVARRLVIDQRQPPRPAPAPLLPRVDGRELTAIFVGGVLGALVRAGLAEGLPYGRGSWPWVTFAVNLAGAFVLGAAVTRLQERLAPTRYVRPFLGTGLCGALTTFSTLQLELLRMLDDHHWGLALGYAAASLLGGFGAVLVATNLVRRTRLAS